jgi:MFS family permease
MTVDSRVDPAEPDTSTRRAELRKAAKATLVGNALEHYDFALYGTASALVFNHVFFPDLNPTIGFIASFGAYAVGFGARPLGGMFFSHLGDRHGRKFVMVATLLLMGIATFAIGCLPTYDTIGILAPVLLVVCRFFQGFGAGAEQASGVVLLVETALKGRRGGYASFVYVGSAMGTGLGAAVWVLVQLLPHDAVVSWGWRLVFWSSVFVTISAYFIRRHMKESPVFEKLKEEGAVKADKAPIADLFKNGPKNLFRVFFLNIGPNSFSYIVQVFLASYVITHVGIGAAVFPRILLVGAFVGAISAWVFGTLSDRYGRRQMYIITTSVLLVYPFIAFGLVGTGNIVLITAAVILGFIFASFGAPGISAAFFPELFGSRYRYSGVALDREFSSVAGGGLAPLICSSLIAWASGAWWPVAIYMVLIMIVSLVTAILSPETRDRDLMSELDADEEARELRMTGGDRAVETEKR